MRHLKLIVAALSVCALSACVIAPYPRQAGYYPEPGGVGERRRTAGAVRRGHAGRPVSGAVWIGGTGAGRVGATTGYRAAGTMVARGYAWNPHRWESRGGRWYLQGGGWRRH
jgi:hypothetical protein